MNEYRSLLPVFETSGFDVRAGEIGWIALGPTISCTVVATFVVALRWYTRACIARCAGKDDLIILISMLLSWTMCILVGLEYDQGFGVYNTREIDTQQLAKLIVVNNAIWCLATNITKASILAQYLRIFSSQILRYLCGFLLALLLLSACWGVFVGTFLCRPIEKLWQPGLPGHCMDALTYWISAAGVNSTLDLCVLILPLPFIMTLRLPHRQKVCISTLFMLGFIVFIISLIRIFTVYAEAVKGDHIKSGMYAVLWSAVEVNIGIMCASLLALKPLISRWIPNWLDQSPVHTGIHEQDIMAWQAEDRPIQITNLRHGLHVNEEVARHDNEPERPHSNSRSSEMTVLKEAGVKVRDFASDSSVISHSST